MNQQELKKLQAMLETILLRNSHFVRHSSGLFLALRLTFRYKVCEYLTLVARQYQHFPKFLHENASINVKNNENQVLPVCSGFGTHQSWGPCRPSRNYSHLFKKYGLDQINYLVEVADDSAIEDKLGMGINVYSFFDEEGKGRHPVYAMTKEYPKTFVLLYWDEHYEWFKNF